MIDAKGRNVSWQEVSSWFQFNGEAVCFSGLSHIPSQVWLLAAALPLAWWVIEKTTSTLWSEIVKHALKRGNFLDMLTKTRRRLEAANSRLDTLTAQLESEQKTIARLFVENDRVLLENLRLNAEVLRLKAESFDHQTKMAEHGDALNDQIAAA